jgi:hypothetical protein
MFEAQVNFSYLASVRPNHNTAPEASKMYVMVGISHFMLVTRDIYNNHQRSSAIYIQDLSLATDDLNPPGIIPLHSLILLSQNLKLLAMTCLDILARDDRIVINRTRLHADVGLGVGVELSGLVCEVEVDGVGPGKGEEDQGDAHSVPGADLVCDVAKNDWDNSSTTNRRYQERRTTLSVTP